METLDSVIKTATDLKPSGYYGQETENNKNNNTNNNENQEEEETISQILSSVPSISASKFFSPPQPPQLPQPQQPPQQQKPIELKWRQTKILLSSDTIPTGINNNNISPDCNIESNTTFNASSYLPVQLTNNNGYSNNNNNININNNNNNNNSNNNNNEKNNKNNEKNKNLSYHRYRKGSYQSIIEKAKASKEKRANILREIQSTEQAYISFLKVLVDVYLMKIKDIGMSDQDIDGIFSNIGAIKLANEDILSKLREKIEFHSSNSFPENVEIADVFLEFGPFLKIYSIFVNNYYNKAISIIKLNTTKNNKFKLYLAECKSLPASKKLDLNDLMIMPIQRLVRYVLLLEELIQHTPESTEPNEHKKLIEAKNVMKDVASFVNQSTVDKQGPLETLTRVQQTLGPKTGNLIQPHRRFIKSGDLVRVVQVQDDDNENDNNNNPNNPNNSNENKPNKNADDDDGGGGDEIIEKRIINIYLFNDLIIYAINNKFWRKIYLVEVWIRSKEIKGLQNVFEIYSKSLSCIFQNQFSSDSSSSFQEWSSLIQSTINKLLIDDSDAKEKRFNLLEQDDQIQKDFTFEERQFYFESMNNPQNPQFNDIKLFKDSLIEDGIVEDRKKKIESLITFRPNIPIFDQQQSNNNSNSNSNNNIENCRSSIGSSSGEINLNNNIEQNGFSDSSDTGVALSDNSDNEEAKKKRNTLKKRMVSQNNLNYNSNKTSGVTLLTQQLTGKNKSASLLSHIALTRQNIVMQGYLTKIGEVVKNWKRRWFIFESNYLFYLKNEQSSKVLGIIPLIGSKIENIDQTSFNISTTSRTYLIIADSQNELSKWTKSILDFHNSRDNFINNIKQQYSNSPNSSSLKLINNQQQQQHQTQQQIQKRLSWLSAALPNINSSFKKPPQNDRSKTIANFRFTQILNENNINNNISDSSLSKSVDALSLSSSNTTTTTTTTTNNNNNNNNNNDYEDDCDSLSSEEEFDDEEEEFDR
ncbi:hypothetical protein ACTFIR_002750 [Dictyostelium discoideum]